LYSTAKGGTVHVIILLAYTHIQNDD